MATTVQCRFCTCGLLQANIALFKEYCVIDQQMICCNII